MSLKPLVALVGRPNVGKSTLFNRIIGRRLAVVSEIAGTTRDRLYADGEWGGKTFALVDTGGIELLAGWGSEPLSEDSERFLPLIVKQAQVAIQDADVIVQVVDGPAGLTRADREISDILRQSKKPIIIAANKLESSKLWNNAYEFYELGLGEVFAISALHGSGVGDLLDAISEALPPAGIDDSEDQSIKIAIMGRPNVGKSTLLNRLINEERAIVSPIAGTTRDAIDTRFSWHEQEFTLIDTAGIRRRGKIDPGIEQYSVLRSMKALKRADIALLLVDASEGITAQDTHVAGMIADESTGVIVLVNKWDAIEKDTYTLNTYTESVRQALNFIPYAPILFISAETGQRVNQIMPNVMKVYAARHRRVSTAQLNKFLRDAIAQHPPPQKSGTLVKFYYLTQANNPPPTFVFFANKPEFVHFSYQRYLENRLREIEDFSGTPIRLIFRPRNEEK